MGQVNSKSTGDRTLYDAITSDYSEDRIYMIQFYVDHLMVLFDYLSITPIDFEVIVGFKQLKRIVGWRANVIDGDKPPREVHVETVFDETGDFFGDMRRNSFLALARLIQESDDDR